MVPLIVEWMEFNSAQESLLGSGHRDAEGRGSNPNVMGQRPSQIPTSPFVPLKLSPHFPALPSPPPLSPPLSRFLFLSPALPSSPPLSPHLHRNPLLSPYSSPPPPPPPPLSTALRGAHLLPHFATPSQPPPSPLRHPSFQASPTLFLPPFISLPLLPSPPPRPHPSSPSPTSPLTSSLPPLIPPRPPFLFPHSTLPTHARPISIPFHPCSLSSRFEAPQNFPPHSTII
ncbi:unnamed protein product [Closterium sp. NIES-64]|nr:unnamed protein product [Closterium sp. NIES-64]